MTPTETARRLIRYGDKEFELDAGMTLDQAKSIMARHFPELADPDVRETKKDGTITYTFTKKAGRKGARGDHADTIKRLLAIPPAPILPDPVISDCLALMATDALPSGTFTVESWETARTAVNDEARHVFTLVGELSALAPMSMPGSTLL